MQFHFTYKSLIAFVALLFICHEIHESAHTIVAYFQCGCWGQRDFNVWAVCTSCAPGTNTIVATIAGPFVTYSQLFIGWWLMGKYHTAAQRSVGFALVWANVPFARLFTIVMKGGDEVVVTRALAGSPVISVSTWLIEIAVVLLLLLPALLWAWKILSPKNRLVAFITFLLGPMLIQYLLMHIFGNKMLAVGLLNGPGILGMPLLVTIWTGFWLLLLVTYAVHLTTYFVAPARERSYRAVGFESFNS